MESHRIINLTYEAVRLSLLEEMDMDLVFEDSVPLDYLESFRNARTPDAIVSGRYGYNKDSVDGFFKLNDVEVYFHMVG